MEAARLGSEVVWDALDKPKAISTKQGAADIVTETDKNSEKVILDFVQKQFPSHRILGEEGGLVGGTESDYLWCIDPLDGTTNFAHSYPSFATSVGLCYKGKMIAGSVVEFTGGPFAWATRNFSAGSGLGATVNGKAIGVSSTDTVQNALLVTGFGYDHGEAWALNMEFFKHFTDKSRGVRRLGSAAIDLCHVALGITESYFEFYLKPWDVSAGVLIVEEAGGKLTTMDGRPYDVFERSVLASNGLVHDEMVAHMQAPIDALDARGIDLKTKWMVPEGYTIA